MRQTIIIHSGLAWREARKQAAENRQHGLQVMTIEALSARLAGGFLQPISADDLKQSIRGAIDSDLGELDEIKLLPGFPRAAAQSLSRAWNAGIDFDRCSASASVESALRISAIQKLEAAALRHLNPSLLRPSDLVAAALKRIGNAAKLFGAIEIQGRTEMSPVWRPLITALSSETKVTWASGPRFVPGWVRTHGIALITSPTQNPAISKVSCASPKHEVLEALRWVRELIASGKARPQDIGIAAASPEEWDDHFIALSDMAGLDVHFVHGRKALTTPEGQLAASLAEVLLRGPSQTRVARLVRRKNEV